MKKLKGAYDFVKLKYLVFVFAAAIITMLPTRVYQLLAVVETDSGFFAQTDVTVLLVYALAIIFPLLFMVLAFISKEVPSPKLPAGKNMLLGVASLIMAAGLIADIISIESKIVPRAQISGKVFFSMLSAGIEESGGIIILLQFIFAFLAVIYFAVFAVSNLNGKASYKEFKLLALAPLAWSVVKLVTRLMQAISFLKVSELLFEMFMLVFLMAFFITFARISSGVFNEDSMWGIYGYGFSAALFGALVTVPRLVMMAAGKECVNGHPFDIADFCTFIFVLSYIFASLGVGFKDGVKNRKILEDVELPDENDVVIKSGDDEKSGESVGESFDVDSEGIESTLRAYSIKADDLEENFAEPEEEEIKEYIPRSTVSAQVEEIPAVDKAEDIAEETVSLVEANGEAVNLDDLVEEPAAVETLEDLAEETSEAVNLADLVEEPAALETLEDLAEETSETVNLADLVEEPAAVEPIEDLAEDTLETVDLGDFAEEPAAVEAIEEIAEEAVETATPENLAEKNAAVETVKDIAEEAGETADLKAFDENTAAAEKNEEQNEITVLVEKEDFDDDDASARRVSGKKRGILSKKEKQNTEAPVYETIKTVSLADLRKNKKDDE